MNEFAALLYDKVNNLGEGLKIRVPYAKIQAIFRMWKLEKSDLE
jgi:hypothetical protein